MRRSRHSRRQPRPSLKRYKYRQIHAKILLLMRQRHQEARRRWGRIQLRRALYEMYVDEQRPVDYDDDNEYRPHQRYPSWVLGWLLMAR